MDPVRELFVVRLGQLHSRVKPSIFTSRRSSAFSLRVIESVDQL
jgi:hypothetical protein